MINDVIAKKNLTGVKAADYEIVWYVIKYQHFPSYGDYNAWHINGMIREKDKYSVVYDANGDTSDASFSDIYTHWAKREINIVANNGWVLGYTDGTFQPNQNITRAEAMAMVNRVLQRIPQSVNDLLPGMKRWDDNTNEGKWYYLTVQEATNGHDYERKPSGYEQWTGLRPNIDWSKLEG